MRTQGNMPRLKKAPEREVAMFEEKTVRRVWHEERWFFSVIYVIAVRLKARGRRKYWNALKTKLIFEGYVEVSQTWTVEDGSA